MTTLTRAEAKAALTAGGWPPFLLDIMVAIGAQESSLRVEVIGPMNSDGTADLGWLQINSRYTLEGPHPAGVKPGAFSRPQLLSDPAYNAKCGHAIYRGQGLGAWVAYTKGDHVKFLPPHLGGMPLTVGAPAWFLVAELQEALNAAGASPVLAADGAFGPRTKNALLSWQVRTPLATDGVARAADTVRLI